MAAATKADGRGWVITIEQARRGRAISARPICRSRSAATRTPTSARRRAGQRSKSAAWATVFFVQPGRSTRNVRVGGETVDGLARARGRRRHRFRSRAARRAASPAGRLVLGIESIVTAGDTAPPDLDELARGGPHGGEDRDHAGRVQAGAAGRRARLAPQRWSKAHDRRCRRRACCARGVRVVRVHGEIRRARLRAAAEQFSLPSTVFKLRFGDHLLLRPGLASRRREARRATTRSTRRSR